MLRPVKDIADRTLFYDFAGIENGDTVADLGNGAEIMGDEDDRTADLVADLAQQMQDLGFKCHIKRRCHLVRNQQLRLLQKPHGDGDALAHAA